MLFVDIDLSLQIESTMKMMGLTPQLYTGRYSNDLLSQLLDYLDITKVNFNFVSLRNKMNIREESGNISGIDVIFFPQI